MHLLQICIYLFYAFITNNKILLLFVEVSIATISTEQRLHHSMLYIKAHLNITTIPPQPGLHHSMLYIKAHLNITTIPTQPWLHHSMLYIKAHLNITTIPTQPWLHRSMHYTKAHLNNSTIPIQPWRHISTHYTEARQHFTAIRTKPQPLPTLSKQNALMRPQKLMRGGLMQKMPCFLSRFWAYTVPTVMAAGRAGGTMMVTMSSSLFTIWPTGACQKNNDEQISSNWQQWN